VSDHVEAVSAPRFGTATLEDCERELIHLAGSVQPHGALLVLDDPELRVIQASENTDRYLGVPHRELLDRPLEETLPSLAERLRSLGERTTGSVRQALSFRPDGEPSEPRVGLVHRSPSDRLVLEVERDPAPDEGRPELSRRLTEAVRELGDARSRRELADVTARIVREITGYDRVMVYRFDRNGHGEVVAEARREDLEPYLGLHYPASDIPRRARSLYRLNRIRLLVDVDYDPVPIRPRRDPRTGEEFDMSLCHLRSMSPIHLQYLKNMGVAATLVSSLVKGNRLWGLVACHHYEPKELGYEMRAACTLLSEVFSARLAVLESLEFSEAELQVRRLESRLVAATGTGEDWRRELFRQPELLLRGVDASGVVLRYEGRFHTCGEVPGEPSLERLLDWIRSEAEGPVLHCSAVPKANPALSDLAGPASGVLATEIDASAGEYLVWLRPERIEEVRWAGDPRKPVEHGNEPGALSPRRSFAVWSELVRGTSRPWEEPEIAVARMIGSSLRDLVVQIQAMRLLLAARELERLRARLRRARLPTVLADSDGQILLANRALSRVVRHPHPHLDTLGDVPTLFRDAERVRSVLTGLRPDEPFWEGELELRGGGESPRTVAVRADLIPDLGGGAVGYVLILTDLREARQTQSARDRLFATLLAEYPLRLGTDGPEEEVGAADPEARMLEALVANVRNAVAASGGSALGPALEEVDESTRRAVELARHFLRFREA